VRESLALFLNPFFDGRYEDMAQGWQKTVFRDFTAGLIVAMVAIPLAMGFAIASGLHPVHGIVGGAFAGLLGSLFGGSKYQVYGPTAAYIPIIAGVMATYAAASTDPTSPEYAAGYGVLILCSVMAGICLMVLGFLKVGSFVQKVPHSIVVGFTIGIAATIALTQIGDMLGIQEKIPYAFLPKVGVIAANIDQFNPWSLALALGTFFVTRWLINTSVYIPGPLVAVGICYVLGQTLLSDVGLTVSSDKYGPIPTEEFFKFTPPVIPELSASVAFDLLYFTVAIVFVAAVESLLCSRMADRMAHNKGTTYNPNKELFGQGMVNTFVPLLNGFPHTGALARTATNIKVGAVTPLAGILKCILKLAMAFYLASVLDLVPMASIGGILAYIAFNMVKREEISIVMVTSRFHVFLMVYTAVVVLVTDFLTGVLTALLLYGVLGRFFDGSRARAKEVLGA
jgi:SulP family sulfate permease